MHQTVAACDTSMDGRARLYLPDHNVHVIGQSIGKHKGWVDGYSSLQRPVGPHQLSRRQALYVLECLEL